MIGAGSWGTAVAVLLARGGLDVQLGTRDGDKADEIQKKRENEGYLPQVKLPDGVEVEAAADIELAGLRPRGARRPVEGDSAGGGHVRRPHRLARRRAPPFEGPDPAARVAAHRLRVRAGPGAGDRVPRWPRPRA